MPGEREKQDVRDKAKDEAGNGAALGALAEIDNVPNEPDEGENDQQAMKHQRDPNEHVGNITASDKNRAGNKNASNDVKNRLGKHKRARYLDMQTTSTDQKQNKCEEVQAHDDKAARAKTRATEESTYGTLLKTLKKLKTNAKIIV